MSIVQVHNFFVPANDMHIERWREDPDSFYNIKSQIKCFDLMEQHNKSFDCVIDVGAWCGIWSRRASARFKKVIAFEPFEEHSKCFELNNKDVNHILLHKKAVGNENKMIKMETPQQGHTQTTRVLEEKGNVQVVRLDEVINESVDLIKIDAEGYEVYVIQGGEQLLKKYKPMIQIETNRNTEHYGFKKKGITNCLARLGYRKIAKVWPDSIYM